MTSPLTAVGEERLREILAGCEGVTPGPWKRHKTDKTWVGDGSGKFVAETGPYDASGVTSAHIARLDPDTVKEMCRLALIGLAARRSPVPEGDGLREAIITALYGQAVGRIESTAELLEALIAVAKSRCVKEADAALASPAPVKAEAEVVAWMHPTTGWVDQYRANVAMHCQKDGPQPIPLYATPSSGGRREALEEAANDLARQGNAAYVAMIDVMKSVPALGYEAKLRAGEFGKTELDAHVRGGELLGQHRAFIAAAKLARALANTNPTGAEE